MNKAAKLWTPLEKIDGSWEVFLEHAAFVQIFSNENPVPNGAFAFQNEPGAAARIRALVNSLKVSEIKIKLVAPESFEAQAKKILNDAGLSLGKIVTRPYSMDLLYEPSSGKILVAAHAGAPVKVLQPTVVQKEKIRVLVVDDSPTIRKLLTKILNEDPEIEVMAGVGLPSEVPAAIEKYRPHVITLDIHLPEMTGVDLLRQYIKKTPIPTVMISSISMEEGPLVLSALEAGAVDYIQKPSATDIAAVSPLIISKVKAARLANVRVETGLKVIRSTVNDVMDENRIIAIGSSTGGTEALRVLLTALPEKIPPILIVQHIPAVFSKAFADRMNDLCPFTVVEAKDGERVEPGKAIIAPGGLQMSLQGKPGIFSMRVEDSAPVNRHKPSVDVLFHSVAKLVGDAAIGVILTGMGADGAQGLLAMKKTGSPTFAQDEASCVVFGMPQAAHKIGAADLLVPLNEMAGRLAEACSPTRRRKLA